MCGLALLLRADGQAASTLAPAGALLRHRGPDGTGWLGWWRDGRIRTGLHPAILKGADFAIVHHRLAIIDRSIAGHQPMSVDGGATWLAFNGEIYNHEELRAGLRASGIGFHSRSDTEVLAHILRRDGVAGLGRLAGMYALAFIDAARGRLLIARDPLGIKPLYWSRTAEGLALASEIKALRILGAGRQADPQGMWDFLRHGLVDHRAQTCFAGIQQVPQGTWIEFDLRTGAELACGRIGISTVAAGGLAGAFDHAVSRHLVADVPVGFALSGGTDSSGLLCTAARQQAGPLVAIGFQSGDHRDESRWMQLAAEAASAKLVPVLAATCAFTADLDDLVRTQDEPFGSTSIYAQYCVFRAARQHGLTVMIDGQGADELFAGYVSAISARAAEMFLSGDPSGAGSLIQAAGRSHGLANLLRAMASHLRSGRLPPLRPWRAWGWLQVAWFRDRGVAPLRAAHRDRRILPALLADQVYTSSLPQLLRYEDRNSMRFSIESRVPFCDAGLVAAIRHLPPSALIADDGTTKAALRALLRGTVPDPILDRRDKIGFAAPESTWLRMAADWARTEIAGSQALSFIDGPALYRQWESWMEGKAPYRPEWWRALHLVHWWRVMGFER